METEKIITILTSEDLQQRILWVRMIFLGIGAFLLVMILFLLAKTSWARFLFLEDLIGFLTFKPGGVGKFTRRWQRITRNLQEGTEESYKTAILEAEEMMDGALEKMGHKGDTLSEKIENLPEAAISNRKELREALAARNKIVYDPNYRLSLEQAEKILKTFEQALKDLQVF